MVCRERLASTLFRVDRWRNAFTEELAVSTFSAGDRVSQPQYGDGTVTVVNEYHTVIDFDVHGPRTFATPRVQLERSTTPAPVKPTRPRRSAKRI